MEEEKESGMNAEGLLRRILGKKARETGAEETFGQDRALRRRRILTLIPAAAAAMAASLLGAAIPRWTGRVVLLILLCVIPPVWFGICKLLERRMLHRLEHIHVEEMERDLLSRREQAEASVRNERAFLRRWRIGWNLLAGLLGLDGMGIALLGGMTVSPGTAFLPWLYGTAALFAALCRIPRKVPVAFMEDDKTYVDRAEFPALYALADRAAKDLGVEGEIHLSLETNGDVGVALLGDHISLVLGIMLLDLFSEEELLAVLHHEFAHVAASSRDQEEQYALWLQMGRPSGSVLDVLTGLFSYADMVYGFHYELCRFAMSLEREQQADQAMLLGTTPEVAASALIKTFYNAMFEREDGYNESEAIFKPETPRDDMMTWQLRRQRSRLAARQAIWDDLMQKEILARTASHPTVRMRLETLGPGPFRALPDSGSAEYLRDRSQAAAYLNRLIREDAESSYAEIRRKYYLEPLEKVEAWKREGEPLSPEGYRDVVEALMSLGRTKEAEALCDRAIAELPGPAAVFGRFIKGCMLLHRYDRDGVALVYQAMEQNQNYLDEGMDEIGEFCCFTGDQAELDRYRAQAPDLMQKQIDEYSQIGELGRGDALSEEHLPEGVLEDILAHIKAFEQGAIDRIYLVRKTISPELFVSAFVVKFRKDCSAEKREEVLHQIFLYLDTSSDWQYALHDYEDVRRVPLDRIPGSLVYSRKTD